MRILFAITSCHKNGEQRQAQRETWLADIPELGLWIDGEPALAYYRFFLGGLPARVGQVESDCVYLECADDYPSLSRKTRALMQYARADDFDFVFKCDDDTFVRVARLLACGFQRFEYSGFTEGRGGVTSGSSQIPFRYAQGGAGYFVSRRPIAILANSMLDREYCEDAAVGKTLALHGIEPVHRATQQPQVGPLEIEYPAARRDFLTLHKCNADTMRRLYRSYREQEQCEFA